MVVAAADNFCSQTVGSWARSLVEQGRLAASYFDERHVWVSQSSFRRSMEKIKALVVAVRVP